MNFKCVIFPTHRGAAWSRGSRLSGGGCSLAGTNSRKHDHQQGAEKPHIRDFLSRLLRRRRCPVVYAVPAPANCRALRPFSRGWTALRRRAWYCLFDCFNNRDNSWLWRVIPNPHSKPDRRCSTSDQKEGENTAQHSRGHPGPLGEGQQLSNRCDPLRNSQEKAADGHESDRVQSFPSGGSSTAPKHWSISYSHLSVCQVYYCRGK